MRGFIDKRHSELQGRPVALRTTLSTTMGDLRGLKNSTVLQSPLTELILMNHRLG
jgi:hypothetical protein